MRTRVLPMMLVLAAALLPRPGRAAVDADRSLDRLLDDRGAAFVAKDPSRLAATTVSGPFAEAQLRDLRAAADVPIDAMNLRISRQFSGELATPRVRRAYPGREVAVRHVVEETRIGGVERLPYVEDSLYTFVREAAEPSDPYDGWRLASTSDFEGLGIHSATHPWQLGELRVARSDHFLILARPGAADDLKPLINQAEAAWRDVARWWPRPVDERYVIVVPATTDELGELFHTSIDLTKFVAFAGGTAYREDGWEPAGVRLYINLPNFLRYDDTGRRSILAHEIIHAVTRPVSGPLIPVWVEEGLAMAGSEPERGLPKARGGPEPVRFPTDDMFHVGPTSGILRTYRQAQAAMELLEDRAGPEGLARFYESVGSARVAPGTSEYHVARAAREVGWGIEEWLGTWRERLR